MAVIEHTTYTDQAACARSITYITDGHGLPTADRTNRYVTAGHAGITLAQGYQCPADPVLAAGYMEALRWNYERQHPPGEGRKKGSVTHVQIYVSPTEEDHVPPGERMAMTRELIQRTALRDFPAVIAAHDNTDVGHCHISVCPFAPDGSHKLCVNNKLLNDLRREMDHICVEHGYSIIDNPELRRDPEYRAWFEQVQAEGTIKIHPPRKGRKTNTRTHKRARDYAHSKRTQRKHKEERENYFRTVTGVRTPETEGYFYTCPYLYHPNHPDQPIRVKRFTPEGKERPELELRAAAQGGWALLCRRELEKRNIPGTGKLRKRLDTIHKNTCQAIRLMQELDLRSHEELIFQIKEVGEDIGGLKRELHRLELESREPSKTPEQLARIRARKESREALLEERKREYRRLKHTEKVLHPASCKDAWEDCLVHLTDGTAKSMAYSLSAEDLENRICEVAETLGYTPEEIDRMVLSARDTAARIQHRQRRREARWRHPNEYQRNLIRLGDAQDLYELSQRLEQMGFLGFLLSLFVDCVAGTLEAFSQINLEIMQWDHFAGQMYQFLKRPFDDEEPEYYPELKELLLEEVEKVRAQMKAQLRPPVPDPKKPEHPGRSEDPRQGR